MADSTSPALNRTLDTIGKCTGLTNYREWGRKVRQAFGLYAFDMLKVLDGTPCPEEADVDGVNASKKANTNIYSILYFHTEGSANITVRAHESTEVGCLGDSLGAFRSVSMGIRRKLGVRAGRNCSPPRCRPAAIRLTSYPPWTTCNFAWRTWGSKSSMEPTRICY